MTTWFRVASQRIGRYGRAHILDHVDDNDWVAPCGRRVYFGWVATHYQSAEAPGTPCRRCAPGATPR